MINRRISDNKPYNSRELFKKYMINFLFSHSSKNLIFEGREYPKISVVIPSYNSSKYIERSILSVINQNYPNVQLIIIDGKSSDGTNYIINNYQRFIQYWVSEQDRGQSDALNKGFKIADGDIFCWLNADDLFMPGAFFVAVDLFAANKDARIVFGDWITIDDKDRLISYNYASDFNLRHFVYEGFTMNSQACFWRREVHIRFGEFSRDLHRTMDYEMILRFAIREGEEAFVRIAQPLACFRRHVDQKTQGYDHKVDEEQRKIAARCGFSNKFTPIGFVLRKVYRVRRAYWYARRAGVYYVWRKLKSRLLRSRIES